MPEMNVVDQTMDNEKTGIGTKVLGALVLSVGVIVAFHFGGRYLKRHANKRTEYQTVEGQTEDQATDNETAEN